MGTLASSIYGRGAGVGRGLGDGDGSSLGVGVGLAVDVGVAVAVGVGVPPTPTVPITPIEKSVGWPCSEVDCQLAPKKLLVKKAFFVDTSYLIARIIAAIVARLR